MMKKKNLTFADKVGIPLDRNKLKSIAGGTISSVSDICSHVLCPVGQHCIEVVIEGGEIKAICINN
jgi:hypothetical protein